MLRQGIKELRELVHVHMCMHSCSLRTKTPSYLHLRNNRLYVRKMLLLADNTKNALKISLITKSQFQPSCTNVHFLPGTATND